jgi:hypothetical protein
MHHLPYSHRSVSSRRISLCYTFKGGLGVVLMAYKNFGNESSNVVYLMKSRFYGMTAASFFSTTPRATYLTYSYRSLTYIVNQ